MDRKDRFEKLHDRVSECIKEIISRDPDPDRDFWIFSVEPSGQVHACKTATGRRGYMATSGQAPVVVCEGLEEYFRNPDLNGKETWEEQLKIRMQQLMKFVEDEPTSEVRWPEDRIYWFKKAYPDLDPEAIDEWE